MLLRFRIPYSIIGLLLPLISANTHAIINGVDAGEDEFPWIAALVKKGNFPSVPVIGGGALVGKQWIITTAHSLRGETAGSFEVWLQTPDLNDLSNRISRNVIAIFLHPDFAASNGTSENDIAMLLLDQPVEGIEPVPFETSEDDLFERDPVVTAGWGTTTPGAMLPGTLLKKAPLELMTRGDANLFYGGILSIEHIPARDPNALSMPCFGDSGGPMLKTINSTATLIGLVSFGQDECDDASIPSIFTNVTAYDEWIQSHLDLTLLHPDVTLTGKGRVIGSGDLSPRKGDNTDFGTLPKRRRTRTRSFRVVNSGDGLLTVRRVTKTSRRFSIRTHPAALVSPGGSSSLRIRYRSPGRKSRHRALVTVLTNDPDDPILRFRIQARSK